MSSHFFDFINFMALFSIIFFWGFFGILCLVLWSCPITFFSGLQNEDKSGPKFGDNWPPGKVLIKNGATTQILSNGKPTTGNISMIFSVLFQWYFDDLLARREKTVKKRKLLSDYWQKCVNGTRNILMLKLEFVAG